MPTLSPFAQKHIQAVTGGLLSTAQYTPVVFNNLTNSYVNCIPRATKLSISEAQVQHIIKALAFYNQSVGPVMFDDYDGNSQDLQKMLEKINFDNINDILSTHGLTM